MIVTRTPIRVAAPCMLVFALTGQVWAQTNEEAFEQFQWKIPITGSLVGNVQAGGSIMPAQAQRINGLERSRFNLGNDDTTVKGTFGGGVAIGRRVQADVAYVWKERFVLSLGASF